MTAPQQPTIGVAMSGGGHRASLFGLGALLYLIDAGKGAQLGSIASVSGGSLTNAFFGLNVDLTTVTPETMWQQAQRFAYKVARRGTLWASPLTYLYLLTIALMPLAAVTVSYLYPGWRSGLAWVAVLLLGGWLLQQRSAVAAAAFACTLLGKRVLSSMNGAVCHIICATDLQTGQDVFFAKSFVYSWHTGWGTPGRLRAARAAQASAALPGAFSVVSLPLKRFGLPEKRMDGEKDRHPPARFRLLDGGVYDNMGTEWLLNIGDRMRDGTPPVALKPVEEAIVVNASASDDVIQRPWLTMPFVGEVASLLAVNDVMYRQTTAVRRRLLNLRYRIAQKQGSIQPGGPIRDALRGTTIQIDRSPFEVPNDFRQGHDALAARAHEAIDVLKKSVATGDAEAYWTAQAGANRAVKTTLSRIDTERAQSLIRHGYVLTMINSHVLLGYPLLAIPSTDRFAALLAKSSS